MQAGKQPFGSSSLGAAVGSFNLDFQRLALAGPARWSRHPFPDLLRCLQERKRAPLTLMVNQFSNPEGIRVFFPTHCPVMGWPWISGAETELVGQLGFRLRRTFLWSPMLIKAHQHSGEPSCPACSSTKTFSNKPFVSPSPKGISAGLVEKQGLDIIFGLGTASPVPSKCPRPNNNPF